jgi:hypothetical protein
MGAGQRVERGDENLARLRGLQGALLSEQAIEALRVDPAGGRTGCAIGGR